MRKRLSYPDRRKASRGLRCALAVASAVGLLAEVFASVAFAQSTQAASLPESIYWKQNLFLIPYQWSSAADPAAAQAVLLFVSKDDGSSWQKISEAKPHVTAFNYHAEGDGAYAFSIRTLDAAGRALPEGPHRAELYVIVDTTIPSIEELAGSTRDDGLLELRWSAIDRNLDPTTLKIEVQTEPGGIWQSVPLGDAVGGALAATGANSLLSAHTSWQPPAGSIPAAVRATVFDRAGNSAVYQAAINPTAMAAVAATRRPVIVPPPATQQGITEARYAANSGWVTRSTPDAGETASLDSQTVANPQPLTQPWPAGATARAPFRIAEGANGLSADAATTYGTPQGVRAMPVTAANQPISNVDEWTNMAPNRQLIEPSSPSTVSEADRYAMTDAASGRAFRPLEPFREVSLSTKRDQAVDSLAAGPASDVADASKLWSDDVQPPHGVVPKQVDSRNFALEYELAELGERGVSRVELWGTRDGGQSWRRFAEDEDHRSPLYVTVDNAGLYGFRMIVEAAGGPAADIPRAGDRPELWVAVDLGRPHVELVSIQPGSGNLADHLVLRWQAADDNLEPRPIALFYSSQPAGPWSAIATDLQNTGEYAWRIERYVPTRVYLRLEARDMAGNFAAYQTAEPVVIESPQPAGILRAVAPVGPTATGAEAAYR
jgi:hypothetical protein